MTLILKKQQCFNETAIVSMNSSPLPLGTNVNFVDAVCGVKVSLLELSSGSLCQADTFWTIFSVIFVLAYFGEVHKSSLGTIGFETQ